MIMNQTQRKKNCAVPRDAVLSVMSVTDVDSVLSVNYYVH